MNIINLSFEEFKALAIPIYSTSNIKEMIENAEYPLLGETEINISTDKIDNVGDIQLNITIFSEGEHLSLGVFQTENNKPFCAFDVGIYIDNETGKVMFCSFRFVPYSGKWDDKIEKQHMNLIARLILSVEYYMANPKKILRISPNMTQQCSNKLRKRIYRTLKTSQIVYMQSDRGKGHHRSPAFEFEVRGHWRSYKSGKKVWIKPHKRCEGKGPHTIHEYQLFN